MKFCPQCGASVSEEARFCSICGGNLAPAGNPAAQPVPSGAPNLPVQQQPMTPQPYFGGKNFSNITVRYRCPNGHVFDGNEQQTTCPTCNAPLPKGGYIQLYRMGNYLGMAVGMGIYIDETPCGHIGNKQSLRISVPYGSHKLHVTHTTTRKCNDPILTVTPQQPYVWCKAHFSKAGFAIKVEPARPEDMPEK